MKGKIIKYIDCSSPFSRLEYEAIILEHRLGYEVRKTWSDKAKFVDCPLIKIFWIRTPSIKPSSALDRMSTDWDIDSQLSFKFAENSNNYIIDDWNEFKSEWYCLDHFESI